MEKVPNGNVIFDLAVNADAVDRRAGDTGEIARRAVHASVGRARAKQACDGLAAAPHDATGGAISNHTEVVTGSPVYEAGNTGIIISIRYEPLVSRTHGSLPRMQTPRAGTFSSFFPPLIAATSQ